MSNNLERLLTIIKTEADLIDKINAKSDYRYKSIQRLILQTGQPFVKRIPSPFKGKLSHCFQNCFNIIWKHQKFHYCEGFAIDDNLSLAVSHAWLINDASEVIDPTWKAMTGCAYFGVVFNREYVMEVAGITKHYGILNNDYMNDHKLQREGFPEGALLALSFKSD